MCVLSQRVLKASVLAKFAKTRKPLVSVQEIARMQSKFGTPVNARTHKRANDLAADSPTQKKSRPLVNIIIQGMLAIRCL